MLIKTKRQIEVVSNRLTKMFSATGYYTLDGISRKSSAFREIDSSLRGALNIPINNLVAGQRWAIIAPKRWICL